MRLPTFSRQSDTTLDTADRAPVSARTDTPTQAGAVQADRVPPQADRAATDRAATDRAAADRAAADRADDRRAEYTRAEDRTAPMAKVDDRTERFDRVVPDRDGDRPGRHSASIAADRDTDRHPAPAGPKPRASLLATLGLITGVAAALLVLSGPLLGYGIGLAVLSLVLSILGLRATRKRHVAGKTDALIGLVLALASIVVGVLALTGSLSWLGTDTQSVNSLREWLDTRFTDRF